MSKKNTKCIFLMFGINFITVLVVWFAVKEYYFNSCLYSYEKILSSYALDLIDGKTKQVTNMLTIPIVLRISELGKKNNFHNDDYLYLCSSWREGLNKSLKEKTFKNTLNDLDPAIKNLLQYYDVGAKKLDNICLQ